MRRALVLAILSGCGSEPAAPDIWVTVYDLGQPVAGATVWFDDPDTGETTARGVTDADGSFAGPAPRGATVSAAFAVDGADVDTWQLYSVVGAQVGDDLWVGDRRSYQATELGTVAVQLPGPVTDAWTYEVSIGCKLTTVMDPAPPVALAVDDSCVGAGGALVVRARAFAFDDTTTPLAVIPGQMVVPPAGDEVVPVALPAWQTGVESFELTLSSLPAGAIAARSEVSVFHDGLLFDSATVDTTEGLTDTLVHGFEYGPGPATRLMWRSAVRLPDGLQLVLRTSAIPPPPTDGIDFAVDALPPVTGVTGAIAGTGSPSLSWQGGAVADGMIAIVGWDDADARVRWTAFAPADGSSALGFPRIPDSLASLRGPADAPVEPTVFVMDADQIDGYLEFRLGSGQELLDPPPPSGELRARVSASGLLAL